MVATSILSTDAEMLAMAGENVNTTGFTDANKTAWGLQAEAYLAALSQYDWSTNVATIDATTAKMLSEYVARYVALNGISYNLNDFTTRVEAEDMINLHIWRMLQIEKIVINQDYVNYVKA